jgi:nicotinate-nucleotide pyrophosphorylase (carboxylating)
MTLPLGLTRRLEDAGLDPYYISDFVRAALDEDLDGGGDVTTLATVDSDSEATGDFIARGEGIVAGLAVAEVALWHCGAESIRVGQRMEDGSHVWRGNILMTARGPTRALLTAERTALNIVCHLSGVATLTRKWVDAVVGTSATIRDTRKTTPLMRRLERYAVRCGGGANHRMSLSDSALVKDNHALAAGGVGLAYKRVRAASPDVLVQVEVGSVEEALEALEAGAGVLLLDNMPPSEMRRAVRRIGGRAQVEASGSLSLERAWAVAQTGVDGIAVSALAQSAPALDIALDLRQSEGVY